MSKTSQKFKAVLVSSIGGGLEMYDFVIYAFFASVLAPLFFPAESKFAGILMIFAVFALGYLVRPIGAIIFGHIGDKIGRKKGLLITILIMAFATTAMAVVPTYHSIGIAAPIILVVLRMIQGIALGGDLPGAITLVCEHSDNHDRGLQCSWIYVGVTMGILIASAVATILAYALTAAQLAAWGWRVAFAVGLIVAIVGFYLRSKVAETPHFSNLAEHERSTLPIVDAFKREGFNLLKGMAVILISSTVVGLLLYMPTYLHMVSGLNENQTLFINTVGIIITVVLMPIFGYLSDRTQRRTILGLGTFGFLICAYPMYMMLASHNTTLMWTAIAIFYIISAMTGATYACALGELFSTSVRYTSVGLTYNLGFALFGGLTPLAATYFMHLFNSALAPAYLLMVVSAISLVGICGLKKTCGEALRA